MRTIMVDDEAWVLKQLQTETANLPDVEIIGVFRSACEALDFVALNPIDFALLDIQMRGMDGIELGKRIKALCPNAVIIYITSYAQYYRDAFEDVRADYYILKPFEHRDIADAVGRAKLLASRQKKRVRFQTFGRFDLFVDGSLVVIRHAKAKELLAVCVDHKGGNVTMEEAIDKLWPEEVVSPPVKLRYRKAVSHLNALFFSYGIGNVFSSGYANCHINSEAVECDYYAYLKKPLEVRFEGEYMFQYSWAEETTALLSEY